MTSRRLHLGLLAAALVVAAVGLAVAAVRPDGAAEREAQAWDDVVALHERRGVTLSPALMTEVCERHRIAVRSEDPDHWDAAFDALNALADGAIDGRDDDQRHVDRVGAAIYDVMQVRCPPAYLDILDRQFPAEPLQPPAGEAA